MVPQPGKVYVVVPQWQERTPPSMRQEEAYKCLYAAGYPERTWVFGANLPHPGDEGRGVTFNVHEDNILQEVAS